MCCEIFIDVLAPPFSPRPDVAARNDKDFADEFVVVDFLGRLVSLLLLRSFAASRLRQSNNCELSVVSELWLNCVV